MQQFVWVQNEFPWIGFGFIHAVAESYADEFTVALQAVGFHVTTMECGATGDVGSSLKRALDFPDWCGTGWDAFNDCFREIRIPHPFVLVWRGAGDCAAADPKTYGEATAILWDKFNELSADGIQAILVITGDGPAFRRPSTGAA